MTKNISADYKHTLCACYIGYITQAIVNNFLPLLFLNFHTSYDISLDRIGMLVAVNFLTQLAVDLLSAKFADKIGYRKLIVSAHIFAAAGLVMLGIFPDRFADPYFPICVCVVLYAVGGGLTETLISPITEACPTNGKSSAMSLLHSFYSWGSVLVVLASTLLFSAFGIGSWKAVACFWALIPAANAFYFSKVPIGELTQAGESMSILRLFKSELFWILALMMLCSGASELAMSQWASAFAESGLGVSKAAGDIAGPCLFAFLMGCARLFHSKLAGKTDLLKYLAVCAAVCVISYLTASLAPTPFMSLVGCGLCGLSVGAMWPGVFSFAGEKCPGGGTAMFALLALAGDAGCSAGPAVVGLVSVRMGDEIKSGIISAALFPLLMLAGILLCVRTIKKAEAAKTSADK